MSSDVANAVIQHINTGDNMNKCAVDNGCFMQSVKSALEKVKKYDDAAEEYGEL